MRRASRCGSWRLQSTQAVYGGYGFQLVLMPWSEVYTGLKQGIVEGLFSNTLWSYQYKHTEVAKHITMTGGVGIWHIGVMSLDRWNSLPEDLQEAVDRAAAEAEMVGHMYDLYLSDKGDRGAVDNHQAQIYHPTKEELQQWIDPGTGPVGSPYRKAESGSASSSSGSRTRKSRWRSTRRNCARERQAQGRKGTVAVLPPVPSRPVRLRP